MLNQPLPSNVAYVARVTLTGRLLPVNDLSEKLEALAEFAISKRYPVVNVIISRQNITVIGGVEVVVNYDRTMVSLSNRLQGRLRIIPADSLLAALKLIFNAQHNGECLVC